MTESDFQTELIKATQAVSAALAQVQAAAGPERAAMAAQIMIGLATRHLLYAQGPKAARDALCRVWADLAEAVAEQNGGASTIN